MFAPFCFWVPGSYLFFFPKTPSGLGSRSGEPIARVLTGPHSWTSNLGLLLVQRCLVGGESWAFLGQRLQPDWYWTGSLGPLRASVIISQIGYWTGNLGPPWASVSTQRGVGRAILGIPGPALAPREVLDGQSWASLGQR